MPSLYYNFITNYLSQKISELDELGAITSTLYADAIIIIIKSFTDNTEKIFKDPIKLIKEEPQEKYFKYLINSIKNENTGYFI